MNKKYVLSFMISQIVLINYAFGDNTVVLSEQQLAQTQAMIQQNGNGAIKSMSNSSQALSQIKFNALDIQSAKIGESAANAAFKTKPMKNKLPNGQKYYLYSESVVSQNQEYLRQYAGKPLDLNKTISDYNSLVENAKSKLGDNRLLVFISSSLPKKTIVNLMTQASPLGAVFVVRGLMNGSYAKTYKYFYELKGENTVGIMINPTMFKAMNIQTVPTFALYKSDQDLLHTACSIAPSYTKVSGEITVHYALEQLKRSKEVDLAQIAANELDILDSSPFYKGKTK